MKTNKKSSSVSHVEHPEESRVLLAIKRRKNGDISLLRRSLFTATTPWPQGQVGRGDRCVRVSLGRRRGGTVPTATQRGLSQRTGILFLICKMKITPHVERLLDYMRVCLRFQHNAWHVRSWCSFFHTVSFHFPNPLL